jgi:hypothetical protein
MPRLHGKYVFFRRQGLQIKYWNVENNVTGHEVKNAFSSCAYALYISLT